MNIADYITDSKKIDKKFYAQFEKTFRDRKGLDSLITTANERLLQTLEYFPLLLESAMKDRKYHCSAEEKKWIKEYTNICKKMDDDSKLIYLGMMHALFFYEKNDTLQKR